MPQAAMAAYSIYQGVQAGKAAKDDAKRRDEAMARSEGLGIEERDYYRNKFGPANQMLIDYALGNKPSPYLAKAKGQVEGGYTTGMQSLNEVQAIKGLGMSGIGAGQKIGLGMERAKALAGLDLQDSAQRYGVAQQLGQMEAMGTKGAQMAQGASMQSGAFANADMMQSSKYAADAMNKGAQGMADYFQGGGASNDWSSMMGQKQKDNIEGSAGKNPYSAGGDGQDFEQYGKGGYAGT